MNESKAKRLIIAGTVGAVILAVILLVVMIYQLIAIAVRNNRIEDYKEKIAILNEQIEKEDDNLTAIKEREWIIYEARKLGYYFEGDDTLK